MERIKGIGPHHAKIALVGEAYGAAEEKAGKPFVGKSGYELNRLLHACEIDRDELYITNVVNSRPARNDFSVYYKGSKPTPDLVDLHIGLRTELAQLPLLEKVVCLGKEATYALTGKGTELYGYWEEAHWKPDVWILPTYHPATIFRAAKVKETDGTSSSYNTRQIIACHLMKAQGSPKYETHDVLVQTLEPWGDKSAGPYIETIKSPVAVDIEVINKEIVCIGFSQDGVNGYCLDLRRDYKIHCYVRELKALLEDSRVPKIFHNAPYDIPWLTLKLGWKVNNFWDTMVLQKSLFPDMPKSLKFCAGIHCNLPYWKDDLKLATETVKGDIDWQQLMEYNCMDVIATHGVFTSLMDYAGDKFPHLAEDKTLMEAVMEDMILGGINVDFKQMKEELVTKKIESEGIKEELDAQFGCNVNSTVQLAEYAEKAGLMGKTPKRTATGRLKMDGDVLLKLAETDDNFKAIVDWKKENKLISTYYKPTPDPVDTGKWHCTFNILTKTGRFSSSSSPFGHGYNLQNVPSSVRHLFVPTEGWRFCSVDLKSGDNTVFAALTGDDSELALIQSGANVHTAHASQVFNVPPDLVAKQDEDMKAADAKDKSWRQMAKKMCHAVNYGAQYTTIASTLGIKRAAAKALMTQWFSAHPQIRKYHEWVAAELRTQGHLTTPIGRRRAFVLTEGERILEDAIAYIPQSTCTGILNRGYLTLKNDLVFQPNCIRAVLQEHDGILYEYDVGFFGSEGVEDTLLKYMNDMHVFPVDIKCPMDSKIRTVEIGITVTFGDTWKEC